MAAASPTAARSSAMSGSKRAQVDLEDDLARPCDAGAVSHEAVGHVEHRRRSAPCRRAARP